MKTAEPSTLLTAENSRFSRFVYGRSANMLFAVAAILLGLLSLAGNTQSDENVTIDLQELALIVENEVDHVTVQELSGQLIKGETNYRLIDLRTPEEYTKYHIPGAENVELTGLLDYPLLRNERIVLYSGGGIHSAQAWFLLKAKGYKATYMLLGGLSSWQDEVLFPVLTDDATPEEKSAFAEMDEVAKHFGGRARIAKAGSGGEGMQFEEEATMTMPVIAPTAPVIQSTRKKAREGC